MEKMLIYKLWEYACNGDIEKLKQYYSEHNEVNKRYYSFNKEHSLIMGAFRNQQYDTVRWLKNHGCRLTHEEQDEINMEYMRIKTIELLASDILKH